MLASAPSLISNPRRSDISRARRSNGIATGKLMLQIIGSIAEFERSIMLSRQLEGIAKAKAAGKYRGGIPTAPAKAEQVFACLMSKANHQV
jgi:DNA invertase Pin-like site-specific DNA recombinase